VYQCTSGHSALACSTANSPACGSWTFESGTKEEWARQTPLADCFVDLNNSTAQSFPAGGHSLAVRCVFPYQLSGSSGGNFWVTAPICAGQAIPLAGRTFHFRIKPVVDAGAAGIGTDDEVVPAFRDPQGNEVPILTGNTLSFQPDWTTIDAVVPSDGTSYGDIGIIVTIHKDGPTSGNWAATFYIDDVQFF